MNAITNLSRLLFAPSDAIGQQVEELVGQALMKRRNHERRWYDNNFFDDGYHFRVISRKTGQVIDHATRQSGYVERAIPRASRQIRGISNLLFAAEPYPVIYPRRISMSEYPPQVDPASGQEIPSPEYEKALKEAKEEARKQGIWLTNEWNEVQELNIKMIDMIIKAAKNSVSWLQVYSDPHTQKIITDVYDAFDIICYGEMDDERKLPFITKACPMPLDKVKSSPMFDAARIEKLTPDNKYATSEIKDAYMRARFGSKTDAKEANTVLVKETFLKEYLTEDNWKQAVKLGEANGAMEGKSKGDMIMRHVFSTSGITLADEYVDYDEYPLVPFRFEPGPLYQVPFIERFIPANKSLDVIMTRLEKWINTMVVGVYTTRKGENFQIANFPGGQKVEYETNPPAQMNVASPGSTPFNVIELMNKFIDEQGASTAALNQLPSGVKSGVAIEQLKSTEYANLKITTLMLKQTMKRIAERMLERADKDYLEPVEVSSIEDGDPEYFDVIGSRRLEMPEAVNKDLPEGAVPISRKLKVRIEIEPGLGLTQDGKKASMEVLIDRYLKLYELGFINPEAMQMFLKRFTETFGYGSTQELMEAMENGITGGQMTDNQLKQIQIAMVQAMKDADIVGPQADKKLVMASKVGTLESLKDAGLLKSMGGENGMELMKDRENNLVKLYKDAPDDTRRQIEKLLGITPSDSEPIAPSQAETISKLNGVVNEQIDPEDKMQERDLKEREMQVKERQTAQKEVPEEDRQLDRILKVQDMNIKQQATNQKEVSPEEKRFDQETRMKELEIKAQQAKQKPVTKTP